MEENCLEVTNLKEELKKEENKYKGKTIAQLERELEIKDKYLELVYQLGVDYDGYEAADDLKSLIDEMVELCKRAGQNDDKYAIFQGGDEIYYNILLEKVPAPEEDLDKHVPRLD